MDTEDLEIHRKGGNLQLTMLGQHLSENLKWVKYYMVLGELI